MRGRSAAAHLACLVGGAAVGARLMYLLDPDRGQARRAMQRDKVIRGLHLLRRETSKQIRNAGNHLTGRIMELRSSIRDGARQIDDSILLDRVRAQLGRDVRHMRMLDFSIENGCVVIRGPVLAGETEKIRRKMDKIRGVNKCDLRTEEIGQEDMERRSGQRGFSPERIAV